MERVTIDLAPSFSALENFRLFVISAAVLRRFVTAVQTKTELSAKNKFLNVLGLAMIDAMQRRQLVNGLHTMYQSQSLS